jgi:predicted membrane metal-binding protein
MITVALGFSAVSGASFAMSAAATAGVMWVAAVALDAIVWPQRAAHVDPIAA